MQKLLQLNILLKGRDNMTNLIMKIKKLFVDILENIKYAIRMIPFSILMILVLYLFRHEMFTLLLTFVIGNFGIDYVMSRNAMIRRIRNKKIYQENFDDDYFDFYNECKQTQFALLYNFQVVLLSCVQWCMSKIEVKWYEYTVYQVAACGIATILWALYLTYNEKEKNINALIFERKKEWGRVYSEKEKELLDRIANTKL